MDSSDFSKMISDALKPLSDKILSLESSAFDASDMFKAASEKNTLANNVEIVVGAFDHSDMNTQSVAEYALKKIGLTCDSGSEIATLNGYLSALKQPKFVADSAINSAVPGVGKSDKLDKLGL